MTKEKTGVFLARMQPLHNAHLHMVEQACKENDKVLVVLGSSNKRDMLRNPFSIGLRESMLLEAIEESIGAEHADKITVCEVPDWSQESDYENQKEWGAYLYYNIVSRIQAKTFSIYFSDDPQIMLNWFTDEIKERINFRFFERLNLFEGLSSTKIRKAFKDSNKEYIRRFCPDVVMRNFIMLRGVWLDVTDNPQDDFSME